MDPFTLISLGSAAIKLVGKLSGGKTQSVADKIAGVVDAVSGLPKEQAADHLGREMAKMPAEDLVEFKKCEVQLAEVKADLEKAKMQAETDRHSESQETIRGQDASTDEFVRRTRPMMARRSFWAGTLYIILTEVLKAFGKGSGADMQLAGMLYSASVFYTTMRTAETFSKNGKSAAGPGLSSLIGPAMKLIGR